jgi:hypothetical protein
MDLSFLSCALSLCRVHEFKWIPQAPQAFSTRPPSAGVRRCARPHVTSCRRDLPSNWPFDQLRPSDWPFGQLRPSNWPFDQLRPSDWPFGQLRPSKWPFDQLRPSDWPFGQLRPSNWPFDQLMPSDWPFGQLRPSKCEAQNTHKDSRTLKMTVWPIEAFKLDIWPIEALKKKRAAFPQGGHPLPFKLKNTFPLVAAWRHCCLEALLPEALLPEAFRPGGIAA